MAEISPGFLPVGILKFVGSGPMLVEDLIATYPPSATYVGQYAQVTNLYGSVNEIMRCSYDGVSYYWRPQRSDYAMSLGNTGGAISLVPLVTPPTIFLTASPTLTNMTLTPSTTNAWPGQFYNITMQGVIGTLLTVQITGLVGSAVSLLTGSTKRITYTAAGWRSD